MSRAGISCRPWTPFENQLLCELTSNGHRAAEIAPQIGRKVQSIYTRAKKLGLKLNTRCCAMPLGDPATWNAAQRLCAFANVPLPLAEYVVAIAEIRGLQISELRSDSRLARLVEVRASIARRASENGYSFSAIGRALNRDHTTIIHHTRLAA